MTDAPLSLRGIAASPGVAVGAALVLGTERRAFPRYQVDPKEVGAELGRFREAVRDVQADLREMAKRLGEHRAEESILEAYVLMVGDEVLDRAVERAVQEDHRCAEWAVMTACGAIAARFAELDDPYLRERGHDVEFVCERLLRALSGETERRSFPHLLEPRVVIAHDLSPADTASMFDEPVVALVTELGTKTSHTAIMARALGIPAVVGAGPLLRKLENGDEIVVDGSRGLVLVRPDVASVEEGKARAAAHQERARSLGGADLAAGCRTRCGRELSLRANVELPGEAVLARRVGAEGIGLYRTEFLYVGRARLPTEDEQYELLRSVVEKMAPLPTVLRTFDVGGDKFVSSFQIPVEMNPMLGLRAVRLGLSQPDLFLAHLRAMARAAAHGDVRIMVPMVTSVEELRKVRGLLDWARLEVGAPPIPLGVMIEVPSAAVLADVFAREAEFLSLGTNDLVQYALAVDRTSNSLAALASPLHPAVLRLVRGVVRAADDAKKPVSICGAMASEPLHFALLVGLGLRDFSMEPASIPDVRRAASFVDVAEAEAVAAEALAAATTEEVERLVEAAWGERFAG